MSGRARSPATRPTPGAAAAPAQAACPPAAPTVMYRSDGSDTMQAWERFLTGDPRAAEPAGNFVVSSWQRSLQLGVDPRGRAAPLAARGDDMERLRLRHDDLLSAAADIMGHANEMFAGSRSIMLLTNPDGVVLEAVGDLPTLEAGQDIHLMRGGDWRERVVGTNGIGTALATGRPAQVHAAEHFCEGIKRWTCAAAPIFAPTSGTLMGVVDISGPPSTYQRNNLALAMATARQIEMVLAERASTERLRLLEACLQRLSAADSAGMLAFDRAGRLVHAAGGVVPPVRIGEALPGLSADAPVETWGRGLPHGLRAEWLHPVRVGGRTIGAMLVVPARARAAEGRSLLAGSGAAARGHAASEADPERSAFDRMVGASPSMRAALDRARQLARRRVPVLIEGETGTGKELLARAVHGEDDPDSPFIALNCGAVSKELLAAELFGHVRGAFTGATSEGRPGRFELAHHGTLCLDEIGELPIDLQPMLLRALEEGVIYRLGDTTPRHVDVRLLAMTNRNLREEVAAGRFRRDLFYRISVIAIRVPPLAERAGDVPLLVEHFNQRLAERHGVPPRRFPPEVLARLDAYQWPGNVRELRNVIEGLLLTGPGEVVGIEELPEDVRVIAATAPAPVATGSAGTAAPLRLQDAEREAMARALAQANGNLAQAARLLGVSRSTLYRKLQRDEPAA